MKTLRKDYRNESGNSSNAKLSCEDLGTLTDVISEIFNSKRTKTGLLMLQNCGLQYSPVDPEKGAAQYETGMATFTASSILRE